MSEQKTPMDVAENEAAQQSAMAVRLRQGHPQAQRQRSFVSATPASCT